MSKSLIAAVSAGATPILLLIVPGVANADAECTSYGGGLVIGCPAVWWEPTPIIGLTVHVSNPFVAPLDCTYTARPNPERNPMNLPPYQRKFHLPGALERPLNEFDWAITSPGTGLPPVATGTEWLVVVDCFAPAGGFEPLGDPRPVGFSTTTITSTVF